MKHFLPLQHKMNLCKENHCDTFTQRTCSWYILSSLTRTHTSVLDLSVSVLFCDVTLEIQCVCHDSQSVSLILLIASVNATSHDPPQFQLLHKPRIRPESKCSRIRHVGESFKIGAGDLMSGFLVRTSFCTMWSGLPSFHMRYARTTVALREIPYTLHAVSEIM